MAGTVSEIDPKCRPSGNGLVPSTRPIHGDNDAIPIPGQFTAVPAGGTTLVGYTCEL